MHRFQSVLRFIGKYEFVLFLIAVLFLSGEVWANQWQLTGDGPAHLYNSIVARELLLHHGTSLSNIFELNSTPVPNCLGHLVLSILTDFFPLDVSDKILHLIIVFGMCLSFRFLSRQINPEQPFYSWLILPFVYSGIYYLGFYNFSLGIVLFLLASATWMWTEKKPRSIRSVLLLTVLSTLLLLAHLIPFLLFVFVVGSRILIRLFKKEYRSFFIDSGLSILIILPAVILIVMYHNGRTELTGDYRWADPKLTFTNLIGLHHLAIHDIRQKTYAIFLSISLFVMAIISLSLFLKRRKTQNASDNSRFAFWGFCWIFLFILVFAAPNDFGGSGDMTFRLVEISWIFFLLFLASGKLPKNVVVSMAIISFSVSMIMIQLREENMFYLNTCPQKVMRLSQYIEPNSTGVYIPLVPNWLFVHVGELAFAEKKSALLSDYETIHDFFILKMSKNLSYNYTIGGLHSSDLPCYLCIWPAQKNKPEKNIDYVLLCREYTVDSTCFTRLNDSLEKYYILKKSEKPFFLYQSRQSISEQKK